MDSSGPPVEPMVIVASYPLFTCAGKIEVIKVVLITLEVHYGIIRHQYLGAEIRAILKHLVCFQKGTVIEGLIEAVSESVEKG